MLFLVFNSLILLSTTYVSYDVYENSATEEEYLFWQQSLPTESGVNTEYIASQEVDTMYGLAQFYQSYSGYGLTWQYGGYTFKIEGDLTKEELINLQESLRKEVEE